MALLRSVRGPTRRPRRAPLKSALAKLTSSIIAEQYSRLASDDARAIFDLIRDEHSRAVERVNQVIGEDGDLGLRPHLVQTVERRNPHIDVLSHVQVQLLRRLRELDVVDETGGQERRADLITALFTTINGIAAGLQTAG